MNSFQGQLEEELYQRAGEVLHYIWDPIGVAGAPLARDEYDPYLSTVCAMLKSGSSSEDMANYLQQISLDSMGLHADFSHALRAASALLEWKKVLDERYT
ncbi:hypothetical protein [Pseudoduganella sp.]|uniref:hypothetical protein n=1 Tax=Pseudoduganella sp. TaxID=1880898 RepID=UPI0035B4A593